MLIDIFFCLLSENFPVKRLVHGNKIVGLAGSESQLKYKHKRRQERRKE